MYLSSSYSGRQTTQSTQAPPTYDFNVRPGSMYTLIMLDPDAPHQNSPWLHMLYINITDPRNIKPANIITHYCLGRRPGNPSPPPRTGRHHYITTLYEQRHPIYGQPTIGDWGRPHFDVGRFVAKYGLRAVASTQFFVDAARQGGRTRCCVNRSKKTLKNEEKRGRIWKKLTLT